MKNNKTAKWFSLAAVGLALALSGSSIQAQNTNTTLWTFPTSSGATDVSYAWFAWNWGGSTVAFDPTQDAQGDPNSGSVYITASVPDANGANGLIVQPYFPSSYPDTSSHPYASALPQDLTTYSNVEFDLKWDTNSSESIDQFNSPPSPYGFSGIQFSATTSSGSTVPLGADFNIPDAASNGWVHINIPIPPTTVGINDCIGFFMQKYWNGPAVGYPINVGFWMDNIKLDSYLKPLPPPAISTFTKAATGLSIVASSSGLYDRHSGRLMTNTGSSWVGHATVGNPVSYSFTIKSFPQETYSTEAFLFLAGNPTSVAQAPDWNEPNVISIVVQESSPTNSYLNFQYKVNEPNNNAMYSGGIDSGNTNMIYTNAPGSWNGTTTPWYESGNLGVLNYAGSPVGTWTIKFTSDTSVTVIAPDNTTTTNFTISPYYASNFSGPLDAYLGMQPNTADALNKAVLYSDFGISNTATPFYENFLTDTYFDSTNTWDISVGGQSANSVIFVPSTALYWISWTLPASGFGLQVGTNLLNASDWVALTKGPILNGNQQLVDKSEIPAGNTVFLNLAKRTFTQLQVLLPGQTNAPGTTLGYVGTPTAQSLSAGGTTVTVNAVDDTFHIISGASDTIQLSASDSGASLPPAQALSNGTTTFSGSSAVLWGNTGTFTVSAQDTTSTTITNIAVSASVTVGP